jgi:hypothetical protein
MQPDVAVTSRYRGAGHPAARARSRRSARLQRIRGSPAGAPRKGGSGLDGSLLSPTGITGLASGVALRSASSFLICALGLRRGLKSRPETLQRVLAVDHHRAALEPLVEAVVAAPDPLSAAFVLEQLGGRLGVLAGEGCPFGDLALPPVELEGSGNGTAVGGCSHGHAPLSHCRGAAVPRPRRAAPDCCVGAQVQVDPAVKFPRVMELLSRLSPGLSPGGAVTAAPRFSAPRGCACQ